ncbi:MAG: hypothetical protein U1E45_12375 [Geminicoccaceae bacterium]
MNRFGMAVAVLTTLVGVQILDSSAARAERSIQVTNGTSDPFWVLPYSRDDVARSVTVGQTSFHILPGQTTAVACGTDSCDLILDRAGGNAPSFRDVRAACINVTTYSASRGIAAYSACGD